MIINGGLFDRGASSTDASFCLRLKEFIGSDAQSGMRI